MFHPEGGQDVGWAVGLPPRTRITLHVDDVPGVQWVGSAVELHSEKPFVVQESEYYCKPR